MKYVIWISILFLHFASVAQNSTQIVSKDNTSYLFGQIYSDFYMGMNNNFQPKTAFVFKQGIIGYKHTFDNKLTGLIMLDVTRTTHFQSLSDTNVNLNSLVYFEGSKYTAYLKMAEIKWDVNEHFILRFGQLLNTQYLTFLDKFWGFRYIDVTFQEKYRFGMPADFGAQVDYKPNEKLLLQFSVVNGEGPFRYQDVLSRFLYSGNLQYNPIKDLTVKLYVGIESAPDTGSYVNSKKIISFFTGYKNKLFGIGGEANYMADYTYQEDVDKYGISIYGFVSVFPKLTVLGRYDYLFQQFTTQNLVNSYYIFGVQYLPLKQLMTSFNFRYYSKNNFPVLYFNVGLKF